MTRPVFAMITINGQKGIGARYVTAACEAAGVETHLIHFKLFQSRVVPRDESARLARHKPNTFVVRVHPHGDELLPHPSEITDDEMGMLFDELGRIAPTLVGISMTSVGLGKATAITDRVHRDMPGVPVIWGGVHTILNPESAILTADIVCTGEGDEAVVEHLAAPDRRDVEGLWFRDGDKITRNPRRPLITDLDRLPFPTFGGNEISIDEGRLITDTRDVAVSIARDYQIVTARGCPFSCTYCSHNKMRALFKGQQYLRRRSVDNVIRELRFRQSQGRFDTFISFHDEVFIKDAKWLDVFAPEYDRHIGLPFTGYAHYVYTTDDMLRRLRQIGLDAVALGYQTGSARISKEVYHRPFDYDRIVELAHVIRDLDFDIVVYEGLTNTQFETDEDCRASLELLLRLPTPFFLHIAQLLIFPGCEAENIPHAAHPLDDDAFLFWNMLYLLTACERMPRDTIRSLADDPYLRAKPRLLDDIVASVFRDRQLETELSKLRQKTLALQDRRQGGGEGLKDRAKRVLKAVGLR